MKTFATFAFLFLLMLDNSCWAQFDQIFNIPPDSVPNEILDNTQLNLFDGGAVPNGYDGQYQNTDNVEWNVFGGTVGDDVMLRMDRLTITGGVIGNDVRFRSDLTNIAGGVFGSSCSITLHNFPVGGGEISAGQFGPLFELSGNYLISGGTFGEDFTISHQVESQGGHAASINVKQSSAIEITSNSATIAGDAGVKGTRSK